MAVAGRLGDTRGAEETSLDRQARHRGGRLRGLAAAGLLLATLPALAQERRYEDAVPEGVPPGFHPVDVGEEVGQIEARERRELEQQGAVDMDYRYATPERWIRARYGGATWNLYEPFN